MRPIRKSLIINEGGPGAHPTGYRQSVILHKACSLHSIPFEGPGKNFFGT